MNEAFIKVLKSALDDLLPAETHCINEAVQKSIEDTNAWVANLPLPTSELNIRLHFLQQLAKMMALADILQDENLLSVLLDDTALRKPGDAIYIQGEKWKVIWRRIGFDFGIEFGLVSESGSFRKELFVD
jgi:hypothetical protein